MVAGTGGTEEDDNYVATPGDKFAFLHEDSCFQQRPEGFIGINDWAQHEADCVTQKLNFMYKSGELQIAADLQKFSHAELVERFPMRLKFGEGKMPDEPTCELEDSLREAIDKGRIPSTGGSLGNKWTRAKAADPELAKEYADAARTAARGEKYDAQNAVRLKWAKGAWGDLEKKRTKTVSQKHTLAVAGTFEPPNAIWIQEGKGLSGIMQMKNLARMCISVGEKYCTWNSSTKSVELMYTKKRV